jgi:hypothetical protein
MEVEGDDMRLNQSEDGHGSCFPNSRSPRSPCPSPHLESPNVTQHDDVQVEVEDVDNHDGYMLPDRDLPASTLASAKYGLSLSMPGLDLSMSPQGNVVFDWAGFLGSGRQSSLDVTAEETRLLQYQFQQLVGSSDEQAWHSNVGHFTDLTTIHCHPIIDDELYVTPIVYDTDLHKEANFYLWSPKSSPLGIRVDSALVLAEIIRRGWASRGLYIVSRELCRRAIPFKPCYHRPPVSHLSRGSPTLSESRPTGLGHRLNDYSPDEVDVTAYEAIRNEFFQSARGHLALYHGGIIARLALDVIDFDAADLLPKITSGSSGGGA